jgi:type II secretory pathway component PulF
MLELQILRYATQIKNPELRKVVSQAAGEYIQGQNVSEILDQRGNVMAVF